MKSPFRCDDLFSIHVPRTFLPFPAILVVILLSAAACGKPDLTLRPAYADIESHLTITAERGTVRGTITQVGIESDSLPGRIAPGEHFSLTVGPLSRFVQGGGRVNFEASVYEGERKRGSRRSWIYVANPVHDSLYVMPTGSAGGYPASVGEETAPNLFRLDKEIVGLHAEKAVLEYLGEINAALEESPGATEESPAVLPDSSPGRLTPADILLSPTHMVDAVARYIRVHVGRRDDCKRWVGEIPPADNYHVFTYLEEQLGGYRVYDTDFPQPADLTLEYSGEIIPYVDPGEVYQFFGDCEDQAILQAALLRRMGFSKDAVWCVQNSVPDHEYCLVLYHGAYRVLDYGELVFTPQEDEPVKHLTTYGYNELHGPRASKGRNKSYLKNYADNYPGGKSDGRPWGPKVYFVPSGITGEQDR